MKVLILGSTGFLGTHLLKQIKFNNKIDILTISKKKNLNIKNLNHKLIDLYDIKKFKTLIIDFKPDICIDLSWSGIPDYTKNNNLKNYKNKIKIYKVLSEVNCRKIISIGSCWEYGNLIGSLSEYRIGKKINNFAKYKLKILKYLRDLNKKNNIKFIWARVFFVYGPGNKKTSLLPSFYNSRKNSKEFKIKNYKIANDYIYVSDVTKAIINLSFNNINSGIYNIGSGKLTSNLYFCNKINQVIHNKYYFNNNFYNFEGFCANIDKIRKKTGWKPSVDLKKGIKLTIDSFNIK